MPKGASRVAERGLAGAARAFAGCALLALACTSPAFCVTSVNVPFPLLWNNWIPLAPATKRS